MVGGKDRSPGTRVKEKEAHGGHTGDDLPRQDSFSWAPRQPAGPQEAACGRASPCVHILDGWCRASTGSLQALDRTLRRQRADRGRCGLGGERSCLGPCRRAEQDTWSGLAEPKEGSCEAADGNMKAGGQTGAPG